MAPQKKFERMPKESRRSAKLWADGARETILLPHIQPFADALDIGGSAEYDYLEKVYQEYHARISWRLADHEEPPLPLAPYNPNAIPLPETLAEGELHAKTERIKTLNERIRRWLKYRVKKIRRFNVARMDSRKDPYTVLLAKLSGVTSPPKARQAYQQFMHDRYHEEVEAVVKTAWQQKIRHDHLPSEATPNAAFRAKVARNVFNQLPEAQQTFWQNKAKAEADAAKAAYEEELNNPVARNLEERQRCIDLIPGFIGPIIQGIQKITKLKFFLAYGGPFPCNGGELSMNHVNYGQNLANEPAYFFQWNRENFENNVMGEFMTWLKTCYTPKDIDEAKPVDSTLAEARYRFDDDEDNDDGHAGGNSSSMPPSADEGEVSSRTEKGKPKKKKKKAKKSSQQHGQVPAAPAASAPAGPYTVSLESLRSVPVPELPAFQTQDVDPKPQPTPDVDPPPPSSPRPTTPPYSPYNLEDPDGPLILPDDSKHDQRRNEDAAPRVIQGDEHPSKRRKSQESVATPRVIQDPPGPTGAVQQLPTPSFSPDQPSSPLIVNSTQLPTNSQASTTTPSSSSSSLPDYPGGSRAPSPPSPPTTPDRESEPSPATSTSAIELMPKCPSAAPKWMHDAVAGLTKQDLGSQFTNLIRSFIAIEAAHGYDNPNRGLAAAGRPDILTKWIATGRWRSKDPVVCNPDAFGTKWWSWWSSLQPNWRTISNKRPVTLEKYGDNWDSLNLPGQNGILSLVATLCWWGTAVNGTGVPGPAYDLWSAAVADVNWIFEGLMTHLDDVDT